MAIVVTANPYLVTTDPVTGTRILRIQLATLNAGVYPAYDGRFLWVSRLTTLTVTPIDLTTNNQGTPVNISTNPVGFWLDKRFLWKISSAGNLVQVDLSTGTGMDTITLPASTYLGLTGDSRFLWTTDTTNVVQIDPATGTVVGAFTKPTNAVDLHFDGRFLWILTGALSTQGTIKQYDQVTGTEIGTFNVTNYGLSETATGLTGDGRFLYNTERII